MSSNIVSTTSGQVGGTALLRRWAWGAGVALYVACGAMASGAPLTLPGTPPFLTGGVPPNLVMAIDDSGSMDLEVMLNTNDGLAWWLMSGGNPNSGGGSCTNPATGSFAGCGSDGSTNVPATGVLNYNHFFNTGGNPWGHFLYLFPNGTPSTSANSYRRRNAGDWGSAIPPIPEYAWARSVEYNGIYFDPTQTYAPWVNYGTWVFSDSDPEAARPDPVYPAFGTNAGRFDLTKDIASNSGIAPAATPNNSPVGIDPTTACDATAAAYSADYGFRVYTNMVLPEGTCIRANGRAWEAIGAGGCTVGVNNGCNGSSVFTLANNSEVNIRYFPATFYVATAMPATYGYIGTTIAGKAPDGSALIGYEIKPDNFTGGAAGAAYQEAIQNFANWFTYYRKRHMALRAGLGKAFSTVGNMRVDGFRIHDVDNGVTGVGSYNVSMLNIDTAANRQALYDKFYQSWMTTVSSGTPNRAAVANIVRNYKRTTASGGPVTNSCQRNFGMLFTDGFSAASTSPGDGANVGNVDSAAGAPYQDSVGNTMADRTLNAYNGTDAAAMPYSGTNRVRVPKACVAGVPPVTQPWMDCNTNPHMNFYAVTLGTKGVAFDPSIPKIEDVGYPYSNPPTWRTSAAPDRHPAAVDDIWHAAINGRGQLLNAGKATELGDKLASVLNNVTDISGSAASAAVSSGTVSTSIENRTFVVSFDPDGWSGSLTAVEVKPDTTVGAKVDAIANMDWDAKREIFTVNSTGSAVPFRWGNLDAVRQSQLDTDGQGSARLNYLRGDRSNETPGSVPLFRKRNALTDANGVPIASPLGDIVGSAPVYIGAPNFRYKDSLESKPYSAWALSKVGRMPMVYVGANDGMLHAFSVPNKDISAATPRGKVDVNGKVTEEFAFIPGAVFKNLPELSKTVNFQHTNFVDGTPSVIDTFYGGDWHTTLVGGLGRGGQGIYALDVTDPMSIDESGAGSAFMWEFTDQDDPDLGYTYSRPAVVRLHNGDWGVVFGNGYGSDVADGTVGDGVATLFILKLSDGSKLAEIKLPTVAPGSAELTGTQMENKTNGLSTPAVVDLNGDDIVDAVYVGDLYGNMWKIDLSSNSASSWATAYGTAAAPVPLFVAKDTAGKRQPITSRPQVTRGPNGFGNLVLFGTGKYLEDSDRSTTNLHTFYGVYDKGSAVAGRGSLQSQTVTGESTASGSIWRLTSNNTVTTQQGWYLDLRYIAATGEMQITDSVLRNGKIAFTTLIPDTDPCNFGGKSWLLLLDALTGARLDQPSFDVNKDGKFDLADQVGGQFVSGIFSDSIMSAPRFISAPNDVDIGIVTKTDNQTERFRINSGRAVGRQSWRQLR